MSSPRLAAMSQPPENEGAAREKGNEAVHMEGSESAQNVAPSVDEKAFVEGVSASGTANAMLKVDDERAEELRRELENSAQAGWRPSTDEEKKLNSRLNLKLDLMVRSFICPYFVIAD